MATERHARVVRTLDHGPNTRSIILTPEAPFAFAPGAFLSILVPTDGAPLNRAYSIASDPDDAGAIELLVDLVPGGPGSHHLFGLRIGDTLAYTGPWGAFTLDRAPSASCVFIAVDTGIAPILPMVRRCLATASHPTHLLYATERDLYRDHIEALPDLDLTWTTPEALERDVHRRWIAADDDRTRHFFVCGVGDAVHALRDALRSAGYARRAVRYERW